MDAFDADVLIYAAVPDHPLGRRVAALFDSGRPGRAAAATNVGSLLLLPEILANPLRHSRAEEVQALAALLARLDLRPLDRQTAEVAVVMATSYKLHAADAVHLATAVVAGADRFITNNRRDFSPAIDDVEVVYPDDLTEDV